MKTLSTQAGDLPLIPEWALRLHRHAWFRQCGAAGLHRHRGHGRVSLARRCEPRVFQLGLPGSLATQNVVVKFGGVVVKGATTRTTRCWWIARSSGSIGAVFLQATTSKDRSGFWRLRLRHCCPGYTA